MQNLLSSSLLSKNLKIKIYRTIILPVVLYGCETWSLTLREERKLRVFENMVLRRIFGPRRDEVTGEWRRLHNEELNVIYSSPNIVRVIKSRRMRWAGHVARMGEEREVYRFLLGKPEGKRPLGRPRRRWVDNIRMDLQEVGCGYMDWIGLAQDRQLNDLYTPPNIVRLIKSRIKRWADHVARMGRREARTGFWWGNLREKDHLEDPGVDGRIILRWIFRKWNLGGMEWIDLAQDRNRWQPLVNAVMIFQDP